MTTSAVVTPDPATFHPKLGRLIAQGQFLQQESERGLVLTAAAALDEVVKEILLAFLVDCDSSRDLVAKRGGALYEFFARTNAAYALGLIRKNEKQRLQIIWELRNLFAHKWEYSTFAAVPGAAAKLQELADLTFQEKSDAHPDAVVLFRFGAMHLLSTLIFRSERVAQTRRTPYPEDATA